MYNVVVIDSRMVMATRLQYMFCLRTPFLVIVYDLCRTTPLRPQRMKGKKSMEDLFVLHQLYSAFENYSERINHIHRRVPSLASAALFLSCLMRSFLSFLPSPVA